MWQFAVDLNDPANLEAMTFLEKYGYLKPPQDGSEWTLEYAMKKFQGMYRIEKTGIIDEASLEAMRLPRCGGPDFWCLWIIASDNQLIWILVVLNSVFQ